MTRYYILLERLSTSFLSLSMAALQGPKLIGITTTFLPFYKKGYDGISLSPSSFIISHPPSPLDEFLKVPVFVAQHVWAIVDTQVGHAAGIVHIRQELESVQDEGVSTFQQSI